MAMAYALSSAVAAAHPHRVIYVEDSPADLDLVEEAVRVSALPVALERLADGVTALDRVRAEPPDLLLLDLRLPAPDGCEVVRRIRADEDPAVRRTPIVLVSASSSPEDVGDGYDAGANCYLVKPTSFRAFSDAIASTLRLWLEVVAAPPRARATL
jgi:CheY-like chemotaxis protein